MPLDQDRLWVAASTVDADLHDLAPTGDPLDLSALASALLDDPKAAKKIGPLLISRSTLAARVTGTQDLEDRRAEVERVAQAWLDGFVIAHRYLTQEHAKPAKSTPPPL